LLLAETLTNITLAIWVFKGTMGEYNSIITHFLFKIVLASDKTGMDSDSPTSVIKRLEGIKSFPYTEFNEVNVCKIFKSITHSSTQLWRDGEFAFLP